MLETIAYVIGIIGGIATIWNLYYAWKSDRFLRFMPSSKKVDEIISSEKSFEEKQKEIIGYIETNINKLDELKLALRSTKKMYYPTAKDETLKEIIKKAIAINELGFALEVANSAYYPNSKDGMLMDIVEAGIKNRRLELAEKASNRMYYPDNKDKAKKKIIEGVLK
jgi:enoyl reductase-like protein